MSDLSAPVELAASFPPKRPPPIRAREALDIFIPLKKPPAKGVAQISREGLLRRPSRGFFGKSREGLRFGSGFLSSTLPKKNSK